MSVYSFAHFAETVRMEFRSFHNSYYYYAMSTGGEDKGKSVSIVYMEWNSLRHKGKLRAARCN